MEGSEVGILQTRFRVSGDKQSYGDLERYTPQHIAYAMMGACAKTDDSLWIAVDIEAKMIDEYRWIIIGGLRGGSYNLPFLIKVPPPFVSQVATRGKVKYPLLARRIILPPPEG